MKKTDWHFESIENQNLFQVEKLKKTLSYLSEKSPYYKSIFEKIKIDIDKIQTLEDLTKFPTTCKEDIQKYNEQFFCVNKTGIIEYTATSGTLGSPVYIALTQNDLNRLAYNEMQSFLMMGVDENDTAQLMLTLDKQFMAGLAYHQGLAKVKAGIVRTGPGLPQMQVETIQKLNTTVLVAVPSFVIKIIEYCQKEKIDLNKLSVKKILCIGENIHDENFNLNALAQKIKENWNVELYSTYASTEMQTAFTECVAHQGGHHQPDLVIFEIVDEEGNQLKAGEYGEVTITSIDIEGSPLLRFRTGDIACYYDEPCTCGRKSRRISPIVDRKNQMIKCKGTTLFPATIFDILNQFSHIKEYVIEVKDNELQSDDLTLYLSIDIPIDECESLLKPFLQSRLRLTPNIKYLSTKEVLEMQFPNNNRKPIKFIDKRKNKAYATKS